MASIALHSLKKNNLPVLQLLGLEEKYKQLKTGMVKLEKELEASETQCKEKELQLVCQKKKEKELIVAVQRYGQHS